MRKAAIISINTRVANCPVAVASSWSSTCYLNSARDKLKPKLSGSFVGPYLDVLVPRAIRFAPCFLQKPFVPNPSPS